MTIWLFLFAMSVGATIGVVIMAAVAAGRREDERAEMVLRLHQMRQMDAVDEIRSWRADDGEQR